MHRKCLRTECMQPKYQALNRFRVSKVSGFRNSICLDCEADIAGKVPLLKHITIEQHRENERLRAENGAS